MENFIWYKGSKLAAFLLWQGRRRCSSSLASLTSGFWRQRPRTLPSVLSVNGCQGGDAKQTSRHPCSCYGGNIQRYQLRNEFFLQSCLWAAARMPPPLLALILPLLTYLSPTSSLRVLDAGDRKTRWPLIMRKRPNVLSRFIQINNATTTTKTSFFFLQSLPRTCDPGKAGHDHHCPTKHTQVTHS